MNFVDIWFFNRLKIYEYGRMAMGDYSQHLWEEEISHHGNNWWIWGRHNAAL